MEMVGKGPERKGAVWVARRVPDGYVTAHANQPRIHTFPLKDPGNTLYAPDVISFARDKGWFTGKDEEFSFAEAYAPLDAETLRVCEGRVWNVFRRIAPGATPSIDSVKGVPGAPRVPLWVKPERKLSVAEVMSLMRDHFEGTEFDLSKGVGAGPFALPYRWRPMDWKLDGVLYLHDRAISTQQTGFSLVAQARSELPDPVGGVLWFGVDDTYSTVYVPFYCGIRQVPKAYAPGTATLHSFSWDSAFWVFNWVANFAYSRYSDMIRDIQVVQRELEGSFFARQPEVEAAARALYLQSPELARDYLTRYSLEQAERTVDRWRKLGEELLVKYLDGNVKDAQGKVTHPPYPEEWYRRIVAENPELYKVGRLPGEPEPPPEPAPGSPQAGPPKAPSPDAALAGWSFGSREELGPLAAAVPADFPFASHKLVLLPGTSQCGQLPRCCLQAREEQTGERLVVQVPRPAAGQDRSFADQARCGEPGWLVQLPKGEQRVPVAQY